MAEGNEPATKIVSSDEAGSGLWQDAHRATLSHHRLLLDVEPDTLHVRQYDLGRKQQAPHLISGVESLEP